MPAITHRRESDSRPGTCRFPQPQRATLISSAALSHSSISRYSTTLQTSRHTAKRPLSPRMIPCDCADARINFNGQTVYAIAASSNVTGSELPRASQAWVVQAVHDHRCIALLIGASSSCPDEDERAAMPQSAARSRPYIAAHSKQSHLACRPRLLTLTKPCKNGKHGYAESILTFGCLVDPVSNQRDTAIQVSATRSADDHDHHDNCVTMHAFVTPGKHALFEL